MHPNKTLITPLRNVEDVAQVMTLPRGTLFEVAVNPWNGNIVFHYQDNPDARFFTRLIIGQFAECLDMFDPDEHDAPNSGLVDYEDELRYESVYGSKPLRSNRPRSFACAREIVSDEPPVKEVRRG
ncbi:MAG: hypothetical protein UCH28_05500 [Adlercreutzia sp.]|nr:hypothetical protein [Adlercreutzia sp.]